MLSVCPLQFFVARQSLHAILTRCGRGGCKGPCSTGLGAGAAAMAGGEEGGGGGGGGVDVQTVSTARHCAYTAGLFCASLFLGLVLKQDHLHLVLDISGGVCASALGFILPGAVSLALAHAANPRHDSGHNTSPAMRWARFFSRHPAQVRGWGEGRGQLVWGRRVQAVGWCRQGRGQHASSTC
jgi:hypothetical protein